MKENYDEYKSGLHFFESKDYQRAIESFSNGKSIKLDQEKNRFYYLGESYLRIGNVRKGIQTLTIGLLRYPLDIEIKNALAQAISNYQISNEEEHCLREKILDTPDDASNYSSLAGNLMCRSDLSALDESIEIFEAVFQKCHPDAGDLMVASIAYRKKGMIDKAIELCEKAITIDPNFNEIDNLFDTLERHYVVKGNFPETIKKYKKFLLDVANTNDISPNFALAEAYFHVGDLMNSQERFEFIRNRDSFCKSDFIKTKLEEINKKIEKIKKTEERVKQFERTLRKFIEKKLVENNRDIYEKIEGSELSEKIDGLIQNEINKKPYLKKENLNPLDYLTIFQYNKLIELNWDIFSEIFLSKKRLNQHIEYISDFRNQVAHNRFYDDTNIDFCIAALVWFEKIFYQFKM
jgi:tetratricopeptide (TPR) repeat protein